MARARKSNLGFGVMLVVVGGVLLVTRFALVGTAPAWLLGLGVGLALIAIVGSSYGALVGGMILLGLGAGFVGIWVLALILKLRRHWWPLVPGVVLLAVGGARFYRHFALIPPEVMVAVRTWWPALLVVAGAWILIRALRS